MTEAYGLMFFKMLIDERDEETFSNAYSGNIAIVNKLIVFLKQKNDHSSLQWISNVIKKLPY